MTENKEFALIQIRSICFKHFDRRSGLRVYECISVYFEKYVQREKKK